MGFVYILKCLKDNAYYVGSTKDIKTRLNSHQNGEVKFTKSRLSVQLIFLKEFVDYEEARRFEYKVKSWKKRKSIERMLNKPDNVVNQFCPIV